MIDKTILFKLLLLFSLGSFLFLACGEQGSQKRNIKPYYFPIESLKEPLVYEYQSVNDTLGPQYLYFRTLETDTATYFTSNIYNQFFEVEQFSVEEVVGNGMLQKDYFLYVFDHQK